MKIKILFITLFLLSCFDPIQAQNNLKVVLKDGSELVGYISRQRPGEDFTFTTSKATIILPSQKVKSMVDNDVKYDLLSEEWKKWADENDVISGVGNNRTITLSDVITDKGTISKVRILEKGAKIKYLELSPNSYSLSWDTLSVVKCEHRPKLLLSGIDRKYKIKSGMEYEGQYVEEIPGITLSLYRKNGVIDVFNTIDVVKDNRIKINPNQTLLEQSDLIDIVMLKNGSSYQGIIFERNYFGYDDLDSIPKNNHKLIQHDYLLIQLENESRVSINLSDIAEYRKEPNPKYNPVTDILLSEGDFFVNRNKAKIQEAKEENKLIIVSTDTISVEIEKGSTNTTISIESKFPNPMEYQQYKLVKANKYLDKKVKNYYYAFTYEDLVKTIVLPFKAETSVNGTTKIDFNIVTPGIYVFYNPSTKQSVIFKVK